MRGPGSRIAARFPRFAVAALVAIFGIVACGLGAALLREDAQEAEHEALRNRADAALVLFERGFDDVESAIGIASVLGDVRSGDPDAREELAEALAPTLRGLVVGISVLDAETLELLATVGDDPTLIQRLTPPERERARQVARTGKPTLLRQEQRLTGRILAVAGVVRAGQRTVVVAELAIPAFATIVVGGDVSFRLYSPPVERPENLVLGAAEVDESATPVVRRVASYGVVDTLAVFTPRKRLVSGWAIAAPWLVLVGGLLVTGVLAWLVASVTATRERSESLRQTLAQTNRALGQSEHRYQRLVEEIPIVVYTDAADPDVTTLFVSPQVEQLLGVTAEELMADPARWLEFVHPDDRAQLVSDTEEQLRTSAQAQLEYRLVRADGEVRWVLDESRLEEEDGRRIIRGYWLDITERKELETRLQRSQRLEAVGRLAGGVAHDFNNILSVIVVSNELLRERLEHDTTAGEETDAIAKAAERASALTRQLLAFSRRQVLRPEIVDVNDVVRSMEQMLDRLFGSQVELVSHLHHAPLRVEVDPGQLEQVIVNLAVNARDAMPAGGQLRIDTAPSVSDDGVDSVLLVVADTGIGMDPDIVARAFEPFFTTKDPSKGTGLGLATVYGIVEQSNGTVTVTSAPGVGTTFQIVLPRADAVPVEVAARLEAAGHPTHGLARVAIVEDDRSLREPLRRGLERLGFEVVHESGHGADALAALSNGQSIDVLVSDVLMPVMGGPELVRALRLQRPRLPVLFVSGYAGDDDELALPLDERTAFLAKPFTPRDLAEAIEALLSRQPRKGADLRLERPAAVDG
jgi:PAS domain S-box-containing protein